MEVIQAKTSEEIAVVPQLPPGMPPQVQNKAPVADGSFLIGSESLALPPNIASKFTFDYVLSRRKPIIRFDRRRDPEREPGLPSREFWLVDLKKYRIPTPVDDRGLVDYDQVIDQVKATIDPVYQWPEQLSMDHFYWPSAWYDDDEVSMKFCQLTFHKGIVPREWENVRHEITIPPPKPSREVMLYRNESWAIARSLFKSITETERWRRRARRREQEVADSSSMLATLNPEVQDDDVVGREFMRQVLSKHFAAVDEKLKELERIPEEFRFIEPDDAHDLLTERLMRFVGSEALYLVPKVAAVD